MYIIYNGMSLSFFLCRSIRSKGEQQQTNLNRNDVDYINQKKKNTGNHKKKKRIRDSRKSDIITDKFFLIQKRKQKPILIY